MGNNLPPAPDWLAQLDGLSAALLAWYDRSARALPWRDQPTPYRVWISEMMLQQTRVEAALPYFERFVAALPDVAALAAVDEQRLLKLWEGLGYYSRARNLKKAALLVMEQHGGALPGSFESLRALPGLGDYAAGAVASIAFGVAVPAVDGNVLRVFSRLLDLSHDLTAPQPKRQMQALATALLPADRPGDFNQSLMELGALVCLPNGAPRCADCPAAGHCLGRTRGTAASLPTRKPKKPRPIEPRTVLLLRSSVGLALRRRPETGLLASMWELPNCAGTFTAEQALQQAADWGFSPVGPPNPRPNARHIFTHVEWRMTVWQLDCADAPLPERWLWADDAALAETHPLPGAFRAALG